MDRVALEKKHNPAVHDADSDKAAGNIIALDDHEADEFYGSSTTQAYRLKSELFASQGIGSVQPPIEQELPDIVSVSYSSLAYYAGLILGASFWGISSDLIGRRPAFNYTVLIAGIFLCAVAGSMNFVTFSALWAVIGTAAGGNVPPPISSHCIDRMVEPRSIDCLLGGMGLLGQLQLPNRRDSSNLSPSREYGMLPETPRYLLSQGRDEDAVAAVNHVARQNGRPEPLTIGMLREIDMRLGATPSENGAHARLSTKQVVSENLRSFREYAVMFAFTPESFPAPHRGTGTGTASALLRLGGLVASLISSQTGFTSAPIYASAAMWVTVGALSFGLPFETHGHEAL
ncbi:hypothetical protein APSETT444_004718 [Aspergillus pseudonomiae]